MINTEHVTQDLRPPKKSAAKALGKYFRKVEIDYEDIMGFHDRTLSIDGRYASLMMTGSLKDSDHWANGAMGMTFFGIVVFMQLAALIKFGELGPYLTQPYTWGTQLLLLIYSAVQFKKSKKKQALAVVCDRKTGNVYFPAFASHPELVIPFEQVEMYTGSVGYSRGSGMAVECVVPKIYHASAKRDSQYAVLCADNYDQACKFWTLLTEFMDKNKPIPYGLLQSVQFRIDRDVASIWPGTDVRNAYPLDPEIKNNYQYVYHTNYEETVEYPFDEIQHVIAPFSDDPELLKKNIERAYDLNLLLF